jgi:hypothetical protein
MPEAWHYAFRIESGRDPAGYREFGSLSEMRQRSVLQGSNNARNGNAG